VPSATSNATPSGRTLGAVAVTGVGWDRALRTRQRRGQGFGGPRLTVIPLGCSRRYPVRPAGNLSPHSGPAPRHGRAGAMASRTRD
jgi:hypothetical protein